MATMRYDKKRGIYHDFLLVPFYNVIHLKSITIETHSESLSKKIDWSVITWAIDLVTKKPDEYLQQLNRRMFRDYLWVSGRLRYRQNRSTLEQCVWGELHSEQFYP